jgi:serine/threonine protein kinase
MSNGDLTQYIKSNPNADRLRIVSAFCWLSSIVLSFLQLLDVAEGLAFLHEQDPAIIHGDLRAVSHAVAL